MSKYWGLVLAETDRLFEQAVIDKSDDLALSAGRIRGFALLAGIEPVEEPLPKVRPITKAKRKRKPRVKTAEVLAVLERAWAMTCPECGAGPNEACVSLRSTSTRRIGEALTYIHADRAGGSRAMENIPPPKADPDHPVWGGATPDVAQATTEE